MFPQMTTFVRIAGMGSITRAARSLGLSLPMASRHLHWLEQERGTPLVHRTTRQLHLTAAGQEFATRARALPSLATKHPALRAELRLEDRAVDLVKEGVDLAIRAAVPPDRASLVARELTTYRRVVCAAPSFLAPHGAIDSLSRRRSRSAARSLGRPLCQRRDEIQ